MSKTVSKFAFMVGLALAMAFTFSCSGDDGDDNGGLSSGSSGAGGFSSDGGGLSSGVPGVSSSSGGGGLSSGSGESEAKITKSKITGVSQKGPFVEGSTVTLYELNDKLDQTGRSFKSIISDDKGSFEIKGIELISPYAMLDASGYYRNEVTGELSKGPITLFAIADVREKDNINVNLLTHLEYYRVLNLAEGGKSVAEAKKQAQKEILAVFGINGNFENSEDMSIFGASEGDAALLAISVLLQSNLGEGEFLQRLTNFAQSLKESGKWENETAKAAIADWVWAENPKGKYCRYKSTPEYPNNCWPMPTGDMCASVHGVLVASCAEDERPLIISIPTIRNNILAWGLSSEVPDFGKYVNVYWATVYGLGGCSAANEGEIKKGNVSDNVYICKNKVWQEAYKEKFCFENKNKCSYFTDSRDRQRYAYVVIGEQTWMAENLNYNVSGSLCYENEDANCDKYGRLYDWATAKNVCPSGWHLPTMEEWEVMTTYIGDEETEGKKLKATSGWYNGNGTDDYGFSALPGGQYSEGRGSITFDGFGNSGYWWSASEDENDSDNAYNRSMSYSDDYAYRHNYSKDYLFSVRCLKD